MSNKDLKYKNKYFKYKNKYLDLLSQIGGSPPSSSPLSLQEVPVMNYMNLPEDMQRLLILYQDNGSLKDVNKASRNIVFSEKLESLKKKLRLKKSVTKQEMFISVPIHVYHPEYLSNEETLTLAKIFIENIERINEPRIQYMLSLYIPDVVPLYNETPLVFNLQNLKEFILGSLEPLRLRFDNTHHTFDNQLHFELLFIFLCILLRQIKFPLLEIEFNGIQLQIFKRSFLKIIFGLNYNIIKKLIFKYTNITDSEVVKLANALTTNTSLTTLNLSGDIKDEGALALANALIENKTLQTLHFYYRRTYPTDEGALALADALKQNTTLTTLDLQIAESNELAIPLADALKINETLTILYLKSNHISDKGTTALADALKTDTTLTTFDLTNNLIGNDGAKALADALKTNTTLTTLNLMSNLIDDEGAEALLDALTTNTTLRTLELDNNVCSDEIKRNIKNKLARNAKIP